MAIIFDGREFAKKKEESLRIRVAHLRKKWVVPKLVSILVGDDPASALYVSLKKKAAERVGCELEIKKFLSVKSVVNQLNQLIKKLDEDKKVHGIMVQMPIPGYARRDTRYVLESIAPQKDVDGLREDSPFVPATVKAVLSIFDEALKVVRRPLRGNPYKVCVVGCNGVVGRPLVRELKSRKFDVVGIDLATSHQLPATKTANVLISATGVPGLIKADMVKKGAIVIDVGSPKGDVKFDEVAKKVSFITPVPGGVGPVTISCLLENLIQSAYNTDTHTQGVGS